VNQVAVVIPSWNTSALTAKCLQSLSRSSLALEVLVVENASDDDSAMMIARDFPLVRLLRNERNLGFARACNQGIRNSKAPYVLLLNSDTEVAADAVEHLWQFLEANPTYAAAAPRLLQADGSIQRACMNFPTWRSALWFATPLERWLPESAELRRYFARDFDYEHDGDVAQPPAAALLLRRSVLEQLGALDETLELFFNDVDLSVRMGCAGWRTRFLVAAQVQHVGGASTRLDPQLLEHWHLDRLRYFRKHHGRLAGLWVKACTSWAWLDFAAGCASWSVTQRGRRPAGPFGPTTRAFGRFLLA
jgi:GT2 family glycosyltransferase